MSNINPYVAAAKDAWASDNLTIDDAAEFSISEDAGIVRGVWVQAWVFVELDELPGEGKR